jgi:hypothetical protein
MSPNVSRTAAGRRFAARSGLCVLAALASFTAAAPVAGALTSVSYAPLSGSTSTSTSPFGGGTVQSTCGNDATAVVQSMIDAAPNNSTVNLSPGACYRVEGTLKILDRVGLTIAGNGATIRATTVGTGTATQIQNRAHFFIKGGSNVTVRDLRVQGVNTVHRYVAAYAGQHAFSVAGVSNLVLASLTIREVYGDFLTVSPDTYRTWRWSNGVTLSNCTCDFAGRQGVSVTGGEHIVVQDSHLYGFGQSAIDLEPDGLTKRLADGTPTGGGANDVRILRNTFGGPIAGLFFSSGGYGAEVDNVLIDHNTLRGITLAVSVVGTPTVHRRSYTVMANTSDTKAGGAYGTPIRARYVDGLTIVGNTLPVWESPAPYMAAATVWGSSAIRVRANVMAGATSPLAVDPPTDPPKNVTAWAGTASTDFSTCGNRFGATAQPLYDGSC